MEPTDRNPQETMAALVSGLRMRGLSERSVGDIAADLGDLAEALATIRVSYEKIAEGNDASPMLDIIESEAEDHIPGHVQSILTTARRVRRELQLPE